MAIHVIMPVSSKSLSQRGSGQRENGGECRGALPPVPTDEGEGVQGVCGPAAPLVGDEPATQEERLESALRIGARRALIALQSRLEGTGLRLLTREEVERHIRAVQNDLTDPVAPGLMRRLKK